jgi:tRNA (guanine10-N2)-dimethyltransferase
MIDDVGRRPVNVTNLFFLVSGEHNTLPFAEIKAILESENLPRTESAVFTQVLCVNTKRESAPLVANRSSMTKTCGLELFRSGVGTKEIQQNVKDISYGAFLKKGQSFSVRVKSIGTAYTNTLRLEGEIGHIISETCNGVKVDLTTPDRRFFGVLTDSILIFGVKLSEISANRFLERMPGKRPFCHPSTMLPKLARCMVNLARVKPGSLVLDPFCGSGSILVEAGAMGCRVYGSDVNDLMVKGCLSNLAYVGYPYEGLLVGDAGKLPFKVFDGIVTDPPYGRASSTHGKAIKTLVSDFLSDAMSVLPRGGYISIALPDNGDWKTMARDIGYDVVEGHFVREHKSLTRVILIIKKP